MPRGAGRRRRTVLLALSGGLALVLMLSGCISDGAPGTTPSASTTKTKTPKPAPTDKATVITATPDLIADCAAVQVVLNNVTEQYPTGPSLAVGQVPSEDNLAALKMITEGFATITFKTDLVGSAATQATTVIQGILAAPEALLTAKTVSKFNDAGTSLSNSCRPAATAQGE